MDWKRWLILILLFHFGLALVYSTITPYRTAGILRFQGGAPAQDIGAPDERQHANYVQHLLDGKGFPVFKPGSPDLYETYQSHQPPLYYLLSAGIAKVTGQTDVEERSTGLVLRGLNALLGALAIAGIFFIGLWGFRNESIGLLAAAFAALLSMNVALSAAITNDVLLIALCTWALALGARASRDGWTLSSGLLVGLLAGLALLTKTSAIALLPALACLFLIRRDTGKLKLEIKPLAAAVGLMIVLAAPWWVRNQNLYGDPLAMKAFDQAFTGTAKPTDLIVSQLIQTDPRFNAAASQIVESKPDITPRQLNEEVVRKEGLPASAVYDYTIRWTGWWTFRSFFGVFGYMDIFLPSPLYAVLGLCLLGLLISNILGRRRSEVQEAAIVRLALSVFFIVVLLLFIRFNIQYFQAQARYLLPAIASIAIAVGCGVTAIPKFKQTLALGVLGAIMIGLNIYILTTLPSEFERRVQTATAGLSGTVLLRQDV
ncbi:MAG: glycosyltransferase family 39 protein [Fimbriimonadaceae bacterium]|nr:glycosyltransferase family 39 protein [Fimbriimonadaceae bacterium]